MYQAQVRCQGALTPWPWHTRMYLYETSRPGAKLLLHDGKHSVCGTLSKQGRTQNKCGHLPRVMLLKQIQQGVSKALNSWAEGHVAWGLVLLQ